MAALPHLVRAFAGWWPPAYVFKAMQLTMHGETDARPALGVDDILIATCNRADVEPPIAAVT